MFCHITSQIEGDKHADLLGEKGGQGFPHFAALDSTGQVLQLHGMNPRTIDGFRKTMAAAKVTATKLVTLAAKAKEGDQDAAKELFKLRLDLGHLSVEEALKQLETLELNDEEKAKVLIKVANMEVMNILQSIRSEEEVKDASAKFLAMARAGRIPDGQQEMPIFWQLTLQAAEEASDAAVYEEGVEALKPLLESNPRPEAKEFLATLQATLETLKAKSADGAGGADEKKDDG